MKPKISIIVPVYKVEQYIHKCIDSILAQTFTDFEIILVDDGSPDKCGEICDDFAKKDNRIKVIHKSNGGVSSARNRGIDTAKGDYIAFIDPDDTVEPNIYITLLEQALANSADIVVCPIKTINLISNTTSISSVWEKVCCSIDKKTIADSIIPSVLNAKYFSLLSCFNKLYRKSWFDNFKIRFDENRHHGEDVRLNLILLTQINSLVFVEQPLYNYYIRKRSSLTQVFREDFYDYILDSKNFGLLLCHKYNLPQFVDKLINDYILLTLNFMQAVVSSNISMYRKYGILSQILNDAEFEKSILNCQCPSSYYKLLKWICIHKREKVFLKLVKSKNKIQYLINLVV